MEEFVEKPNKIEKILVSLKEITTVNFFASSFLFFCYFESYIRIKFNVDFFQFANNPNKYWNYLSDTVFLLLIFSFTISILFNIIRNIYWTFLYPLWSKMGIDMYIEMKNKEYFAPIFKIKRIAYETNNNILYDMCLKQEEINKKKNNDKKHTDNAIWGVLFFTCISFTHLLISDINSLPVIINIFVEIYYATSKSIILSLVFGLFIIFTILWLLIYLFDSLYLKESQIYKNHIEIGKNNNLLEQIKEK